MIDFLLGLYVMGVIATGALMYFFNLLGGKRHSRISFWGEIIIASILWPITLIAAFK